MKQDFEKKRIAIFLASLRGGGAERAMLNLANALSGQGIFVDLVLVSAEGPYLPEVNEEIQVVNLNSSRVIYSAIKLVRYLRRVKPDVLLAAMTHVNIVAVIASIFSGVSMRLILSEHTNLTKSIQNAETMRGRLLHFWVKAFYKRADWIVAVSKGVRTDLIELAKLSKEKVVVIYNPVVNKELVFRAKEIANHPWLKAKDVPVILGAGRLSKEKDFATLIKAFEIVLSERQVKLIIIGEGPERANLKALIAKLGIGEYVSMPGFTVNPYAYMSRADLFVLSSIWEGLSVVLIEAMACGCPVVSTDCPSGPSEILDHGRYGPLVPVGDFDGLAQAMLNVLANHPDKKLLKERAFMFSTDKISEQYLDILLG